MTDAALSEDDVSELQAILDDHRKRGDRDRQQSPYSASPREQATVLWAASDTRDPFKAGEIAADPRVDLRPAEVGRLLRSLEGEGLAEAVDYSNNSYWWSIK